MSFRTKVRSNTPKVALDSIWTLVAGDYKTGKTRLWKEVTELHYTTPEESLLVAFEPGYETWHLQSLIPVHEESMSDDDLWKVWEFFKNQVVKGLLQEAKDGRSTKLIGVDTADKCIDACTAWVLRDRAKKYGKTSFASLQDITESTPENGYTALYEELKAPFDSLKNAGYGIFALAWVKPKETTLYNGLKYNSIELMMSNTGKKVFLSQASLICCLFNEVVVMDKDGNELEDNIKIKGKDRASNFHETRTMMYFRESEYVSIAGGRYVDLPEEPIPYSAQGFLDVFKKAVEGQLKSVNKSVEEIKIEQETEKEQKAKEFVKKEENKPVAADLHAKIATALKDLSQEQKQAVRDDFSEAIGEGKYTDCQDAEKLQNALDCLLNIKNKK